MKHRDDRPRPIWRYRIRPTSALLVCRMQNAPLAAFICPNAKRCPLPCSQKNEQDRESHYVDEQLHRMRQRVRASMDRISREAKAGNP